MILTGDSKEELIKNNSRKWLHLLHMAIRPGGMIPLDELKEQFQQDMSDSEFMHWIRNRIHKTAFILEE